MNTPLVQKAPVLPELSTRVVLISAIGILAVGGALYFVRATLISVTPASAPKAYAGVGIPNTGGPAPMRELTIANSGLVLLRGATVQSADGSGLIVTLQWSTMTQTWDVHTSAGTKYYDATGHLLNAPSLHAGDTVTVTGAIVSGATDNSINAQFIREEP